MSLKYRVIWSKLSSRKAPPAKRHRIKASGIIFALLKKEAGKYFSSPIYVMNTGIGPILMIIFAISTVFLGRDVVTLLKMPEIAGYIVPGTIAIFCFSASMTSTTAPSISLEGSNLWIIKSSPIEAKDVFWAKLLLNFAVAIPALVVSAIVAGIGLQIAPLEFLWVILLPTLLLILTALVGLIMNLFYHRFDFYNDTQVVKQSASVILTFLIMWILLGILIAGYVVIIANGAPISFDLFASGAAVFLIILIVVACEYLFKKGKKIYIEL
jgi:ABC-2 type transport system permease protein